MEFPEGSWSVAVEIGGLNRDPKKEKMLARERQKQQEEEISMASISESLQLHVCGYIYTPSKVKIEAYCQITLLK
ncbi:hypothetical protein RHGRI_007418 [Rhododendron griersonianum]|uniref:Uncharacterized protein n=1 Tax=Rhododendron griersonianum TaxID=479676 RepID=A0AAV6IWF5_9ERIC|nr:hypothetical protein RHGRI_037438 [Rhododendron griersonianum]KAG5521640.1 hypothetical protein RHGRI_034012 [Rhododendron griersonianum]KAG5531883.1 hypothetical protein RHGRI_026480 [Rhododendron griersonianum]KAG5535192.1 hypothetical protein RHGRI_023097 [Rhododendron griersonianum]KAG5554477.1 hypothetical protein RHGRI_012123 [Rhododendron griersonianum]